MTLPIAPSGNLQPVIPVQQVSATPGRLHLSSGEVLDALVVSKQGDGKVTLQVKNMSIPAESRVALNAGEKITVRVEQTLPVVILRMVADAQTQKIGDLLCLQRSHSGVLAELLGGAKEILDPAAIEAHAGRSAAKNALSLLSLLDSSVFSRTTASNPFFLKDMMSLIGLSFERNLLKQQEKQDRTETAKELLLKLAGDIRDAGAADRMKPILAFLERGVKAIEAQQIAAVLGQELDRSLVLQAACQFPAGIRLQDIFIDQKADSPEGLKQLRAVLFLSMDELGEVIADASAYGNRLDCVLYCETQEKRDFMDSLLPELQDRLIAAGYTEPSLRCALERQMHEAKNNFMAEKRFYSQHAVDIQS